MPRIARSTKIAISTVLAISVLGLRLFSADPDRVERWYSNGYYPKISSVLRGALGWVPFSLGDVLYTLTGAWLLYKVFTTIRSWQKGRLEKGLLARGAWNSLVMAAIVYLWFNLAWGINYNRQGIATQLDLKIDSATREQVDTLATLLLEKTNHLSRGDVHRGVASQHELKERAIAIYQKAEKEYDFLHYAPVSFKSSLFGVLGNYIGYSGYYNPFTGEAQVNDRVPAFSQPYVALHEIGHQLGYAKENEANFVGWLAARNSTDSAFLYSTYFDLFLYANAALRSMDSAKARANIKNLDTAARHDLQVLRDFAKKYESPVDRMVSVFYDNFLKLNQQPLGQRTYSQVVLWLVAYHVQYKEI